MFVSRDSWKSHLQLEHRSSRYWECFACTDAETSEIFWSNEGFMTHMKSQHSDAISNTDILKLLTICERTAPITMKSCPLCISEPEYDSLDPEALLDHIADHIHEFSLLSLPWLDTLLGTGVYADRSTFRRVQNWLGEEMDSSNALDGAYDLMTNNLLHNYFAESVGASFGSHQESSSAGSSLTFDSQPDREWGAVEKDIYSYLMEYVKANKLSNFYTLSEEGYLQAIAKKAAALKETPRYQFGRDEEILLLAKLALYQLIIYCGESNTDIWSLNFCSKFQYSKPLTLTACLLDDSGSMGMGTRANDQLELVYSMAKMYMLLLPEGYGIGCEFLNYVHQWNCEMTAEDTKQLIMDIRARGHTKIGTNLRKKILDPILSPIESSGERLKRPFLIHCITDGRPAGEHAEKFKEEILRCASFLEEHDYPKTGASFTCSMPTQASLNYFKVCDSKLARSVTISRLHHSLTIFVTTSCLLRRLPVQMVRCPFLC